jgi:hypothetical protein
MNTEHDKDTELNAILNSWQAPKPSPWLKTRAIQAVIAQTQRARRSTWPFAPFRLGGAVATALVLGLLLGAGLPGADVINDTIETVDATADAEADIAEAGTADEAALIALLW